MNQSGLLLRRPTTEDAQLFWSEGLYRRTDLLSLPPALIFHPLFLEMF